MRDPAHHAHRGPCIHASVGKQTGIILVDFSKAFDKVNNRKLLWKLQQYGIRGQVLSRVRAFLGSRSQQVVIDLEESESTRAIWKVRIMAS